MGQPETGRVTRQTHASHGLVVVSERRSRKVFLLLLKVEDTSFDGVFDDEPCHVDRPVLADSVRPIHGLELKSRRSKKESDRSGPTMPSSCDLPRPPGSTTCEERKPVNSRTGVWRGNSATHGSKMMARLASTKLSATGGRQTRRESVSHDNLTEKPNRAHLHRLLERSGRRCIRDLR